ncbi:glycosyltransferase family 4 protein [Paenibacillus xerothermodurans]|uniref:Glycosyltransferase family 1 protein n=1 Tax=Paenibacillus xerothermodurans TaxID=1977292 RepID=A0A2W1N556_PAEXE|nr:glycosyltransferase family 1 protein [Paenibacillus xerothermodurans]PZE19829.1 glycosyltransferase family 1 protein [Paenibacillus xerothermodurans]
MRIALFSDTFSPEVNGVALTLKRFTEHLEHRNVPFRTFVPKCTEEDIFTNGIQRFSSLPFMLYPECRIALPNYFKIYKQLQTFQPDLIHIATPFNMGLCGLHYGRKHAVPHVASYHTHFDRYLQYYRLQFAAPLFRHYIRWFHQSCLVTFVPSLETAEQLQQQGIQGLDLWQRGIDCRLFHPDRKNPAIREKYNFQEQFMCLYVGRLAPEKDLDIMIELWNRMPAALGSRIRWFIVGDGPLLKELRAAAPPNVTFTGCLQGESLAELYASADLFVFPSSTETFGNVALEALASGTPVIGARSGGVQEIVHHGKSGLLCAPRDTDSFVRAIVSVLEQPDKLMNFGHEGRLYASTQSWEAIFDGLLLKYARILGSTGSICATSSA